MRGVRRVCWGRTKGRILGVGMHPVPLDSLEKRKIGQKPAAALGRTVDSIKAAFPEYKGSPLY